ncbi:MAG: NUDIX domain-containing protein [Planktomarina sp.]
MCDGILATYQSGIHNEYQLPGGGVDQGEQPIAALHREVFEETGWSITAPRVFGRFKRFAFMPDYDMWAEKICTIYVAQPIRPLGPPTEDGHEAMILPYDVAIKSLAVSGDRAALTSFVASGLKSSITALRSSSKT